MAVIRMNFLSQTLGFQTNVTICVPSFSFADVIAGRDDVYVPGMKYQVLWLLHGATGDDSDYLNFSNITRYADDNKIAVVMPAAFNMGYEDQVDGQKFMTYVAEELPKALRAMFAFSDKREDNFIAGLSMGSMGAQKISIAYPENYAAVLGMSAGALYIQPPRKGGLNGMPMPARNGVHDTAWYMERAKENIESGKKLPKYFMTWGDQDFAAASHAATDKYLKELGYDVFEEIVPGYGHEWDFWDLTLRKALKEWLPIRHSILYPGEA